MKKLVIFHICALPQLYVKQNQSYLRLDPPLENFSGSAPELDEYIYINYMECPKQIKRVDGGRWS